MVNEPHAHDREELLEDTAPDQAVVHPYSADADDDDAVTLQMDAPLDDGEWMVEVSQGQQRRTLSTEQLAAEVASGALGPQARVWRNGMRGWSAAAEVELTPQVELTPETGRATSPAIPVSVRAAAVGSTTAVEASAVAPVVAPLLGAGAADAPAMPGLAASAPPSAAALGSAPLASAPLASSPLASSPLASSLLGALRPAPLPPIPVPPSAPQRRVPAPPPSRPVAASSSFSGGMIGSLPLSPPPPRSVPRSPEARRVEPLGSAAAEPLPAFDEVLHSGRPDTATSVALDLQQAAPRRPSPLRGVIAQGAAAAFAILLTSYGLTQAGVFETGAPVAHGTPGAKPSVTTQVLALQAPAELPAVAAAPAEPAAAPPPTAVEPTSTAATESAAAVAAPQPPASEPAASESAASESAATAAVVEPAAVAATAAPSDAAETASQASPAAASATVVAAPKASEPSPGETPTASADSPSSRAAARRAKQAEQRAAAAERRAAAAEERRQRRATSTPARAVETPARATEGAAQEPGSTFNREAATTALENAATQAKNCRPMGGPSGAGIVQVQYEPSGKVVSASIVTAGFENSDAADCIEMLFRRAKVPAFNGTKPVTMKQRFEIP